LTHIRLTCFRASRLGAGPRKESGGPAPDGPLPGPFHLQPPNAPRGGSLPGRQIERPLDAALGTLGHKAVRPKMDAWLRLLGETRLGGSCFPPSSSGTISPRIRRISHRGVPPPPPPPALRLLILGAWGSRALMTRSNPSKNVSPYRGSLMFPWCAAIVGGGPRPMASAPAGRETPHPHVFGKL